ncbi:MAG TPA: cysteine--tRNA ligase [Ignavibacteriaceae bacterium]|nr:cysteine--tRNA ligase [Ignavibacteriaceae bacterium]
MLSIYNTLTKRKEEFKPINPPSISMYVCGPTVYDYFHIGNARSFIMADVIRRYLEFKGFSVKYVMNLTDVDDKIIKKSLQEKKETKFISENYVEAFFEDIHKLKIKPANIYPKATEHMDDIVKLIEELEAKHFAYNINGNVFYDVSKFKDYGKLSGKKINELESGSRIEINEEKKNPLDFSLWKKAKIGEPYWNSPWGNGRPGWHIECSAMSCKHLGKTFDIHAGGNDLIFPHHENEIAQSEAANDKKFVNYWIHFGFLNINEEKMSKSLGNFFTARDILKKYSAEAIRLSFIQTHYAGPLNFSEDLLASSEKGLEKLKNLAVRIMEELNTQNDSGIIPTFDFQYYEDNFISAMDDNFNSPQASAVIFDFIRDINRILAENNNISKEFYQLIKGFLEKTAVGVFGILDFSDYSTLNSGMLEDSLIKFLVNLRIEAKREKNFVLSDKIRDGLKELGITLQDSKDKTSYKKYNLNI